MDTEHPDRIDDWNARTAESFNQRSSTLSTKWSPRGSRSFYFRDPAGNSIEFAEPRLWESAT